MATIVTVETKDDKHKLSEDIESLEIENKRLRNIIIALQDIEEDNNAMIQDLMMKIEYLEGKVAGYEKALQLRS